MAISFIARAQNTNAGSGSVSVAIPAAAAAGDVAIVAVFSFQSPMTAFSGWVVSSAPAGWKYQKSLDGISNGNGFSAVFTKILTAGDLGTSPTWANLNASKVIMRVYRGCDATSPFDDVGFASNGQGSTSLQIPALNATNQANEWYVGFWRLASTITGPAGMANVTIDTTQMTTVEGDFVLGGAGSIPPAETATSTAGVGSYGGAAFAITISPTTVVANARVTRDMQEFVSSGTANARVTRAMQEFVSAGTANTRITRAMQEFVSAGTSLARITRHMQEFVATIAKPMSLTLEEDRFVRTVDFTYEHDEFPVASLAPPKKKHGHIFTVGG